MQNRAEEQEKSILLPEQEEAPDLLLEAELHLMRGEAAKALDALRAYRAPARAFPDRAKRFLRCLPPLEKACGPAALELFCSFAAAVEADGTEGAFARRTALRQAFRAFFRDDRETAAALFAPLGPAADAGRAALLLRSASAPEAAALLASMEDFAFLPAESLSAALSAGAAFPERLFSMPLADMEALASRLAALLYGAPCPLWQAEAALPWDPEKGPPAESAPGRFLWGFLFTGALVQHTDWKADAGTALARFRLFAVHAGAYLRRFHTRPYAPEDMAFLPSMLRLGVCCSHAAQARAQGDLLGYTRILRTALKSCPAARGMISFLLDEAESTLRKEEALPPVPPNEEMRALCAQVRALLAQYPPDDPAVRAIRESALYQSVSAYIEAEE